MIESGPQLQTCYTTRVITRFTILQSQQQIVDDVAEILKIQNGVRRVNRNEYGIISVVLLPGFKSEEIANRKSLGISSIRELFEKDSWLKLFIEDVAQ